MAAKVRARFHLDTVRELAGGKAFSRGQEYYRNGSVELLSVTPKRVVAQVAGTEDYRTVLTGRGTEIGGECSCPAFEDWGFCKHMVATALAANAAGDGAEAEAVGAQSRMRKWLESKSVDGLVDMILELAERDLDLFRKLDIESAVGATDDKTVEARLRKAIDSATRAATYVDNRHAAGWRVGVEAALDALADIASGPRAAIALRLVEHAIDRIESAFEAIDDSDGHLGELLNHARDIHLTATRATRPESIALARYLFKKETENDFDTFVGAVADYADVLGERGLAEYRRLAVTAWNKLPARSGRGSAVAEDFGRVHELMGVLDFFAERDGDIDARVALRARDLSSPWAYLQLAEFCLSQGRHEEALRRAEEGLWVFEDNRPDERLLLFTVKLLVKARRKADAEAHLWRVFEKQPSLEVYKQIRRLGGESETKRALAQLEARMLTRQRSAWSDRADLLIKILMHEKQFDTAWSAVKKFGASVYMQQELARASDQRHPIEALEVYAAQVEQLANGGTYDEAAKVIARMEKIRSTTEQAAYIADLKVRHGRKRNFMKLLGDAP
jgi:tetratricopeptide (TPR) repeat protein